MPLPACGRVWIIGGFGAPDGGGPGGGGGGVGGGAMSVSASTAEGRGDRDRGGLRREGRGEGLEELEDVGKIMARLEEDTLETSAASTR